MNILKLIPRTIIKKSFNLSVRVIERCHNMAPYHQEANTLMDMPEGTLGNDIAKCLAKNRLNLVPGFESHDLKHVLLDFEMTPVDEIRMQAFMLGNGNYSPACFAILLFGMILLPAQWLVFYRDFLRGRNALPISSWMVNEYATCNTINLRKQVFEYTSNRQPVFTIHNFIKYGAFTSIIVGVAGMLFCLPYLFSAALADLVGVGFPFVGGAVLMTGGLLALSNLARPQRAASVAV